MVTSETADIVVVGAGFAGLGAAGALQASGRKVVVLEGSSRVGGRAWTKRADEKNNFELGGTYFHGLVGHPLYEKALELGVVSPLKPVGWKWGFLQPGEQSAAEDADATRQAIAEYGAAVAAIGQDMQASTEQLLNSGFDQSMSSRSPEEQQRISEAWRWRELVLRIASGMSDGRAIDPDFWKGHQDLAGPNFPCAIGFQRLAERLARGVDIRYNHVVDSIDYSGSGVTCHCSNGAIFSASTVVVSVSVGVLKASAKSLFSPALPQAKMAAIANIHIGTIDKVFVNFQDDAESANGSANGHSHQLSEGKPAVAYHLLWPKQWPDGPSDHTPSHPSCQNVPEWAQGIFSFRFGGAEFKESDPVLIAPGTPAESQDTKRETFTGQADMVYGNSSRESGHMAQQHLPHGLPVAARDHPRTAVLWLSGKHAKAMEACSDAEVEAGVRAVLQAFPAIPFAADAPLKVWRSAWGQDPLFRGSYSCITTDGSGDDIDTLAEPIQVDGQNRVMFCGEATHRTLTGTMGGAFLSGQREAARLLKEQKVNGTVREE